METFIGTPNLQGLAFSSQSDGPARGSAADATSGLDVAAVEAFDCLAAGQCPQLKRGLLGSAGESQT